jgi:hypothetical protein
MYIFIRGGLWKTMRLVIMFNRVQPSPHPVEKTARFVKDHVQDAALRVR